MFASACVISSSLFVVRPGSITEGRTAMGGTYIRAREQPYRDLAENEVLRLDLRVVKAHEATVFWTNLPEKILHTRRSDVLRHLLVLTLVGNQDIKTR